MTRPTTAILSTLALLAMTGAAAAQDTEVQGFGESGTASMFGVTGAVDPVEGPEIPEDMTALVAALEDGPPDIAWDAISAVTEIELVRLTNLEGDADGAGLADWRAQADLGPLHDNVRGVPALEAALTEEGLGIEHVIGALGSAATTVALVIDDRT